MLIVVCETENQIGYVERGHSISQNRDNSTKPHSIHLEHSSTDTPSCDSYDPQTSMTIVNLCHPCILPLFGAFLLFRASLQATLVDGDHRTSAGTSERSILGPFRR